MTATLKRNANRPAGFGRERPGWTRGRLASVLAGSVLGLCSLGLLGVGGYALSATTSNGGWVELGHGTLQPPPTPWPPSRRTGSARPTCSAPSTRSASA